LGIVTICLLANRKALPLAVSQETCLAKKQQIFRCNKDFIHFVRPESLDFGLFYFLTNIFRKLSPYFIILEINKVKL